MRFFTLKTDTPVQLHACGNLISKDGFLHHRRSFNQDVFILVLEGTLHITQSGIPFSVSSRHYIFLKAGEEHFGHCPSNGRLSYLWVHFTPSRPLEITDKTPSSPILSGAYCLFLECGSITSSGKAPLLFSQLLDLSLSEKCHAERMANLALRLLLLEISQETIALADNEAGCISPLVRAVSEWIRINCYKKLSLSQIADTFGYNADYLSSLFKEETGTALLGFLNRARINAAKNLLANNAVSIKEAAYSCGFSDEKYFMKLFKKLEGITPSQYRDSFSQKKIN